MSAHGVTHDTQYLGEHILGQGVVVAIDGPSGSGKSTVSRLVAAQLGLQYLDTGAMYRAVTLHILRSGVDPRNENEVVALTHSVPLTIEAVAHAPRFLLDGHNVTDELHSADINQAVSLVSSYPKVREYLIAMQRSIIEQAAQSGRGIVAEGRDITTVVMPQAPVRILLTASPQVRQARRTRQAESGADSVTQRDAADSRVTSFLTPAQGVTEIDTTYMSQQEVVDQVVALIDKATAHTSS